MYPTSPTYINQATAQTRRSNVRIVAYVGDALVEHNIEPLSVEFSDKREGFVGGFSARTITVVSEELPDNIEYLKVYVGFAGTTEEVLLGQFYIDKEDITYDDIKNTYKFVAYDKATMFDIQYEPLTFPATGLELIEEIATRLGVELGTFSLTFNNYTFDVLNIAGDDIISYRQVISRYAQLNLATAHITADGKLSFKSAFTQSPVATVNGVDYTDLKITKDIRPINSLVYNQEAVEDPVYVRDETSIDTHGINELRLEDNLFIDLLDRTEQQSIVNTLFGIVDGYIYYPFSTSLFIRPDLDAMDIISIQDTSDIVYNTVLENMSWTWNGGLKGAMECNILPETLTDYTLSKEEHDTLVMGIKVNRVEGRIQSYVNDEVEGLSSLLTHTADGIRTEVSETYVSSDELGEYKNVVSTQFTNTSDAFNLNFNTLQTELNDLGSETDEKLAEINKYIQFKDGNIELGDSTSQIKLVLENDIIKFEQGGVPVAHIDNNTLYITDGHFLEHLQIGNFIYTPRSNGSLSFDRVPPKLATVNVKLGGDWFSGNIIPMERYGYWWNGEWEGPTAHETFWHYAWEHTSDKEIKIVEAYLEDTDTNQKWFADERQNINMAPYDPSGPGAESTTNAIGVELPTQTSWFGENRVGLLFSVVEGAYFSFTNENLIVKYRLEGESQFRTVDIIEPYGLG